MVLLCSKCTHTQATRIVENHGPICEICAEKVWTYEKDDKEEVKEEKVKSKVPKFFRESAVEIAKHLTKYEDD